MSSASSNHTTREIERQENKGDSGKEGRKGERRMLGEKQRRKEKGKERKRKERKKEGKRERERGWPVMAWPAVAGGGRSWPELGGQSPKREGS